MLRVGAELYQGDYFHSTFVCKVISLNIGNEGNLAAAEGEEVLLSREQDSKFVVSVGEKEYVTKRKEQANPVANGRTKIVVRRDIAVMFSYKFSLYKRLI